MKQSPYKLHLAVRLCHLPPPPPPHPSPSPAFYLPPKLPWNSASVGLADHSSFSIQCQQLLSSAFFCPVLWCVLAEQVSSLTPLHLHPLSVLNHRVDYSDTGNGGEGGLGQKKKKKKKKTSALPSCRSLVISAMPAIPCSCRATVVLWASQAVYGLLSAMAGRPTLQFCQINLQGINRGVVVFVMW